MRYRSLPFNPFSTIKKKIINTLNNCLKLTELDTAMSGLRLDYSKAEMRARVAGSFNEIGVLKLLKANDFDNIDTGSLCFGETVHVYRGNSSKAPATNVFTKYIDMI